MTKLPLASGNFLLSPFYLRMRFLMHLNLSLATHQKQLRQSTHILKRLACLENQLGHSSETKRKTSIQRRHPSRFFPKLWSVLHMQENNFSRTNNSLEAWHRRFE